MGKCRYKNKKQWIRRLVVLFLIIAAGYSVYISSNQDESPVKKGDPAPNFELFVLDGSKVTLHEYKGKAVILNFWATWCHPCQSEMPLLEEEYLKRKEKPFEILAVNYAETEVAVSLFQSNFDLSFPLLLDPDKKVATQYGVSVLPVTFFINADGIVVSKVVGELSKEVLQENIQKIMP